MPATGELARKMAELHSRRDVASVLKSAEQHGTVVRDVNDIVQATPHHLMRGFFTCAHNQNSGSIVISYPVFGTFIT